MLLGQYLQLRLQYLCTFFAWITLFKAMEFVIIIADYFGGGGGGGCSSVCGRKPLPALLLWGAVYLHHLGWYAAEVARPPYRLLILAILLDN